MAGGVRDIKIRFSGDATGLSRTSAQGEAAVGKFSARTQKFAKAAVLGVAAMGVAFGAALKAGVQGLQEGQEAEAKFTDAISRSTPRIRESAGAFKAYAEQIQRNTRFTYEDTLATGTLLAAQDGVQQAIRNGTATLEGATQVVLDMATAQNVDATTAAKTYAKALAAPEKAAALLRKAGITLSVQQQDQIKKFVKAGDVAKAQAIIQGELAKKFEGSAKAAGETTAGQMIRAQNAFGEVQEQLAVGLLPVLTDFLGKAVKITAWAQDNPAKVKAIVIVLGTLAAVVGTVSAAITVWTAITRTAAAVQAAWNAVLLANPIVLVTVAIIALVAAVVLIATKTTWFQQIWSKAWGAVTGAVQSALGWIRNNWPTVLAILTGPVGLAVLAVVKNFDKIKAAVDTVVDWFKGLPKRIVEGIGDLTQKLYQKGQDLIAGMVRGIEDKARSLPFGMGKIVGAAIDTVAAVSESRSPSRVMMRYGRWFVEGFALGMKDKAGDVDRAAKAMIEKAKEKIQVAKDLARSIRDAFRIDLSASTPDGANIFDRLRQQADQAEQFARQIQKLRKAGLREDLVQQLVGEGPSSLASAIELGGNVSAANQLAGRISSAGSSLGASEAKARTGINVAAPNVSVTFMLDGKEFKGVISTEIDRKNKATKTAVKAGAKRAAG